MFPSWEVSYISTRYNSIFYRGRGCSRPRDIHEATNFKFLRTWLHSGRPTSRQESTANLFLDITFGNWTCVIRFLVTPLHFIVFLAMKSARYKGSNLANRTFRELRTIFYLHGFLAVAILLCKSKFQELLDLKPLCSAKPQDCPLCRLSDFTVLPFHILCLPVMFSPQKLQLRDFTHIAKQTSRPVRLCVSRDLVGTLWDGGYHELWSLGHFLDNA